MMTMVAERLLFRLRAERARAKLGVTYSHALAHGFATETLFVFSKTTHFNESSDSAPILYLTLQL